MKIFFLLLWTLSISLAKGQNPTGNFTPKCSVIIRDVVFVMDASESISKTDFQLAQQFITRMITFLKSSNNRNRFSFVTFADSADIVFDFSKNDSIDGMTKNVDAINKQSGLTAIGKALNLTWVELLPTMRTDAEKLIILLTDGTNNKYPAPYEYSEKLKSAGVKILTIGIGSDINKNELDTLATKRLLVLFDSFTDLLNGQLRIIKKICPITESGLEFCKNPELNLLILMPASFSLNETTFEREKSLIIKLLEKFNSVCPTGRIAIICYTDDISCGGRLHHDFDMPEFISFVKSLQRDREINDVDYAFYLAKRIKDMQTDGVPYQILLLSAGKNIITPKAFETADLYKADGDQIITVGIGSDDYSNEMKALSSNGQFLVINSTDELEEIYEIIYRMITSGHRK